MGIDVHVEFFTGYLLLPEDTEALAKHWGIPSYSIPKGIRDDKATKKFLEIVGELPEDTEAEKALKKALSNPEYRFLNVAWPRPPSLSELRKSDPKYRRPSEQRTFYMERDDACVMFVMRTKVIRVERYKPEQETPSTPGPNAQEIAVLDFLHEKVLHPRDNQKQPLQFLTIVDDSAYDSYYERPADPEDPGDVTESDCSDD